MENMPLNEALPIRFIKFILRVIFFPIYVILRILLPFFGGDERLDEIFWGKHLHHRKYKFIDKKQQLRFAIDVALHSLLFPIFLLLMMILPPFSTVLLGKSSAHAVQPVLVMFFHRVVDNWWVLIPSLSFVGVFSVLFSHRVFGPIRRLENALLQKKENPGQAVPCNLRGGDYFHDFAKLFDEVINQDVKR